jgi:hypothetical protein
MVLKRPLINNAPSHMLPRKNPEGVLPSGVESVKPKRKADLSPPASIHAPTVDTIASDRVKQSPLARQVKSA